MDTYTSFWGSFSQLWLGFRVVGSWWGIFLEWKVSYKNIPEEILLQFL
jgi:hypothetical protein